MIWLLSVCFFLLWRGVLNQRINIPFSGVYVPSDLVSETYAASFLISKERFIASKQSLLPQVVVDGGELAVFAITRHKLLHPPPPPCEKCKSVMTRDYLDFMVEHMSSTTNQISEHGDEAFKYLKNLKRLSAKLRDSPPRRSTDKRTEQTVAMIIFNSKSVAVDPSPFQEKSRRYYFLSTFWSVYRYFPRVSVFVEAESDYNLIKNMTVPYFQLIRIPPVPKVKFNVIKQAMLQVMDGLNAPALPGNVWSQFNYVYYTEGDQILHMRAISDLYNAVDYNRKFTLLVPHRMQTLPMLRTLPWLNSGGDAVKAVHMKPSLVTENATEAVGSCCDNGRYLFGDCGNWWYNCEQFGKINLHYWMQFDKTGLTMPMITEHQGNCLYSAQRQLCTVPGACRYRNLPNIGPNADPDGDYYCGEMPLIQEIGVKKKTT